MTADRTDVPPAGAPLPPPLPLAKRLNRNALTVAAMVMFVTVLVAVVTTRTTRPERATSAKETDGVPATPSQPSFLDVPARSLVQTDSLRPFSSTMLHHAGDTTLAPPSINQSSGSYSPMGRTPGGGDGVAANPYLTPAASVQPTIDPTIEAYRRALRSPVVPTTGRAGPTSLSSRGAVTATPDADSLDEQLLQTASGPGTSAMAQRGSASPPLPPAPKSALSPRMDVPVRTAASGPTQLATTWSTTGARYQLDAGTVIPAALVTAVNSDLPGPLVAVVTHAVYDSRTQRVVVIPQGTKLLGQYDNAVGAGQQRLLMLWTRMIFPDGQSLTLPNVGTMDTRGAAGVAGDVDRHDGQVFRNALLLSVVSAGLQLSQPAQGGIYTAPTARQVAAGAVGQQLGDMATATIQKNLAIPPTITLREGTPMNVFLRGDVVLPEAGRR